MTLTESMKDALNRRFNWRLCNVPELEQPVLVVLDYSPTDRLPPLSIAFDWAGGPKCWMSTSKVVRILNKGPKPHSAYRSFTIEERTFYPYSIRAFPQTIFGEIEQFKTACHSLYQHVDWNE